MNDPKGFIAFLDGIDDNPERGEIVNLVEVDILGVHLLINTVDLLRATCHFSLDLVLEQLLGNDSLDLFDIPLPFLLLFCNLSLDIGIDIGVQIPEAQVLQFIFNPLDPEPICQGGIYL